MEQLMSAQELLAKQEKEESRAQQEVWNEERNKPVNARFLQVAKLQHNIAKQNRQQSSLLIERLKKQITSGL